MKGIKNIGFLGVVMILSLQPTGLKGQTDTLCFNDTILYTINGPAGSEYTWKASGGSLIYSSARKDSVIFVWNQSTGRHTLEVTERNEFDCFSEPEVMELFVYRPAVDLGGDLVLCDGSSEIIAVEPVYDAYWWNNQPGTHEFLADTAGLICLEVKDIYACQATDSVMVIEKKRPEPAFTMIIDTLGRSVTVFNESDTGWQFYWDFGDGTSSTEMNPGIHSFTDPGTYSVSLMASAEGCSGIISREVTFTGTLTADFLAVVEGCAPAEAKFINRSNGADSCYWDFGNGEVSGEENPGTIYVEPGLYEVTLYSFRNSVEVVAKKTVRINRAPMADFMVTPSEANLDEDFSFRNMSANAVRYLWDFGDGESSKSFEPAHSYSSAGVYDIALWVWSEAGCADSLRVNSAVSVTEGCRILFPTGFIPNKNGPGGGYYNPAQVRDNNEIFHPIYEDIVEYEIRIYSRWGEMVFMSDDIDTGWDGYYKGRLAPQDTYIYEARSRCSSGKELITRGSISLIY